MINMTNTIINTIPIGFDLASIMLLLPALFLSLTGTGIAIRLLVTKHKKLESGLGLTPFDPWVGFAFFSTVAVAVHIFVPINWIASLSLCLLGLILFFYIQVSNKWISIKELSFIFGSKFTSGLFFLFYTLTCCKLLYYPSNYDSALYHFGSVQWFNISNIILGLGNLSQSFAMESSYFGFIALMNFYPFLDFGSSIAAGLIILMAIYSARLFYLITAKTFCTDKKSLYTFIIFFVGIVSTSLFDISAPTPDLPSNFMLVVLILGTIFTIALSSNCQNADKTLLISSASGLAILATQLITIKYSMAPSSLIIFLIAVVLLIKSKHEVLINPVTWLLLIGIAGIHFLTTVLLSGYISFPNPEIAISDLSWTIPKENCDLYYWIKSWAKIPGTHLTK